MRFASSARGVVDAGADLSVLGANDPMLGANDSVLGADGDRRLLALIDGDRDGRALELDASRSREASGTVDVSTLAPPSSAWAFSTTGIDGASAFKYGHCWHCQGHDHGTMETKALVERVGSEKTASVCAVCHRKARRPLPVTPAAATPSTGPPWISHEESFGRGETSFSSLEERAATDFRKRTRPTMQVLGMPDLVSEAEEVQTSPYPSPIPTPNPSAEEVQASPCLAWPYPYP